jgi:hypothetical protein
VIVNHADVTTDVQIDLVSLVALPVGLGNLPVAGCHLGGYADDHDWIRLEDLVQERLAVQSLDATRDVGHHVVRLVGGRYFSQNSSWSDVLAFVFVLMKNSCFSS